MQLFVHAIPFVPSPPTTLSCHSNLANSELFSDLYPTVKAKICIQHTTSYMKTAVHQPRQEQGGERRTESFTSKGVSSIGPLIFYPIGLMLWV
jgi:hypothetical protein